MREEIRRSYSTFAGRPSGDLHDFSVLPDTQGKGVGTALLEELERRPAGRGCAKMTLEVRDTKKAAKRLYARFGFEGWKSPTFFAQKPL
jgi:ribosomal protein S18 acetylase RimI-like enzyme